MDHADHVRLLRPAVALSRGRVWADIGSGSGAFTLALADLLGAGATIVSLDRDAAALDAQAAAVHSRFPNVRLEPVVADLRDPPPLPLLDGLVMANALHFVPRDGQVAAVVRLATLLRPGAAFVLVEYDADRGNPYVPYPLSFATWRRIAGQAGLEDVRPIGNVPSRFLGAIYSAVATRPVNAASP